MKLLSRSLHRTETLENEAARELAQFYDSFFANIYNELNIAKYRPIRDAIGLVMRKFDNHDHPLAYVSKLVIYIQIQVAFNQLYLTHQQQLLLNRLAKKSNKIPLNFVYTGPLGDLAQFISS